MIGNKESTIELLLSLIAKGLPDKDVIYVLEQSGWQYRPELQTGVSKKEQQ